MLRRLSHALVALTIWHAAIVSAPSVGAAGPFADVPPGQTYSEAVQQLAERGVFRGYPDGTFRPHESLLRQQIAVALVRAMGWSGLEPVRDFPDRGDVDAESWTAVRILADREVIRGFPDGTFGPTLPLIRQQAISIIARAMVSAGAWRLQPVTVMYTDVDPGHAQDAATFAHYAGAVPRVGAIAPGVAMGAGMVVDRGWFAEALWAALRPGSGTGPGAQLCLGVPAYPEIRPGNAVANATPGRPTDPNRFTGDSAWRPYYAAIDGSCVGTTEQILEWAARKWGFEQMGYPDLAKAIAAKESWWKQSAVGANGEVGIAQVHPTYWPDWEPAVISTAYSADYALAVIRSHYDGKSWLGSRTQGDLRRSVGAWYCGCADGRGAAYADQVFTYYNTKPWRNPNRPPDWF